MKQRLLMSGAFQLLTRIMDVQSHVKGKMTVEMMEPDLSASLAWIIV